MASEHTVLFSAEVISGTVRDLAASIDRDLGGSRLVVIVVLKGAVVFACDLVRATEAETEMAFLSASSYSGGFTPGDTLQLQHDVELDVTGRDVLIVDDITTPAEISPSWRAWSSCSGRAASRRWRW